MSLRKRMPKCVSARTPTMANPDMATIDMDMITRTGKIIRTAMTTRIRITTRKRARTAMAGGGLTARGSEKKISIQRRLANGKFSRLEARLTDSINVDDIIYVSESLF